jgi:O-antigen/teichoic acid export membrane protein
VRVTITTTLRRWVDPWRATAASTPAQRSARVLGAALSALAGRGVSLLVNLVSVPLTVGYLGAERFGAWTTLSTVLAWFQIADLGIGNGLTNSLATAHGTGRTDAARAYLTTALALLSGVAVALLLVGCAAGPFVDWVAFFNVKSATARGEIVQAVIAAVALMLVGFPLSAVDRAYLAMQDGALLNAWSALANLTSLVAIVLATRSGTGIPGLVVATGGTRVAVGLLSALYLFWRRRPGLRPALAAIDWVKGRELARTGALFFGIQLSALVLYNTDNVIIAKILGPEQVTPYAVSWRFMTLPSAIIGLVFPYLWPAYGEALARGDVTWVRKTLARTTSGAALVGLFVSMPMVVWGQQVVRWWAGEAAVPTRTLLVWMGLWGLIAAPMSAISCFLNASGKLRVQVAFGLVTAASNVTLSIILARRFGSTGVIAATVLTYAASSLVPALVQARMAVRQLLGSQAGAKLS